LVLPIDLDGSVRSKLARRVNTFRVILRSESGTQKKRMLIRTKLVEK